MLDSRRQDFDPYAVDDDERKDPDHHGDSGDKVLEEMSKAELDTKLANTKAVVLALEKEKIDNPIKQAMLKYAEKTPKDMEQAEKAKAALLKVRVEVGLKKMRCARIALACDFLRSMVSARYIEHMSVGSGHTYNDYRSYGAGRVVNFSI